MDKLIQSVVFALRNGLSIEDIHDEMIKFGWYEEPAFLAIKAGQILYDAIVKQEAELAKRKPPFRRVK